MGRQGPGNREQARSERHLETEEEKGSSKVVEKNRLGYVPNESNERVSDPSRKGGRSKKVAPCQHAKLQEKKTWGGAGKREPA